MPKFLKTSSAGHHFSYAVVAVAALGFGGSRMNVRDIKPSVGTDPVMVVELFTSESCPECPPAEDSLVAFKRAAAGAHVTLIPLSFHVAYWNQDGWSDPYSNTSYAQRQRAYNGDQLYTPQAVVNGVTQDLSTSLLKSPPAPLARSVTIKPGSVGAKRVVTVNVAAPSPSGPSAGPLAVYLAVTEDSVFAHMNAGENKGRDLHHLGVVRYFRRIGTIGDTAATIPAVEIPTVPGLQHGHISVVVQTSGSYRLRAIVGAGTIPL